MSYTLYDKLWNQHEVTQRADNTYLLYIDRHLIHEVTSPQAFEGLKLAGRKPWRISANIATPDHNVPTTDRSKGLEGIYDEVAKLQVVTLDDNCKEHDILQFDIHDRRQGIVHVVGPEQGLTLPGMTIVCGDSHTSTHGALATLSMGIGTSEVEHVLATQCLKTSKLKNMRVTISGELQHGVTPKDVTLAVIGQIGTAGGTGYAIEYSGSVIENMTIEGRMTVCNMAIEAGARAGLVAYDKTTEDYIKNRPFAPSGNKWLEAIDQWKDLASDEGSYFDKEIIIDGSSIAPQVTWGTSPEMVIDIDGLIPEPTSDSIKHALDYMNLESGKRIKDIRLDQIFIGSCTNSRIEDLREAAKILEGKKISSTIKRAIVVPGSGLVSKQAIEEGLDEIFIQSGFEWRAPGCSMCLAMNPDQLGDGEHCASTSNRNFEGRQGYGGRTHLVSPATAAASAIEGSFVDVREFIS
jgi:3-isopropylmalate/(R)-2-methylmalate dehydratase large subunit|tara:strand:+ start:1616 stop:3010 length:1395 start_codon:yes stop_codon:yes gene_type:complete